jgi:hypothetical protein
LFFSPSCEFFLLLVGLVKNRAPIHRRSSLNGVLDVHEVTILGPFRRPSGWTPGKLFSSFLYEEHTRLMLRRFRSEKLGVHGYARLAVVGWLLDRIETMEMKERSR